jgi:hypothetical protein
VWIAGTNVVRRTTTLQQGFASLHIPLESTLSLLVFDCLSSPTVTLYYHLVASVCFASIVPSVQQLLSISSAMAKSTPSIAFLALLQLLAVVSAAPRPQASSTVDLVQTAETSYVFPDLVPGKSPYISSNWIDLPSLTSQPS